MKSCIYCGERLEDDDLFCTCCGQRQPVTEEREETIQAGQEREKAMVKVAEAEGKSNRGRQGSDAKKATPKTSGKTPWLKKVKRVYDKLPKVCDDKDCGCPNCYGFAMKVAAGTSDMDECPYC